jgi:hypothetical protein
MMHRGWIGQPLLAKRTLLPMHLPPATDGPEHETRKARRAEQFADKPLFREAFREAMAMYKDSGLPTVRRGLGKNGPKPRAAREIPQRYERYKSGKRRNKVSS